MTGPADDKPNTTPKGIGPKPTASVRPSVRPGGPQALIGTTISDRYKIERLLGEGGMGAVYQAEHTLMRKRMAIKVLHPEMTRLPEVVARFEREAMAAAHIEHPNVVTATDFGKLDDGSFFLALEYVEGKSLRDAIAKGRLELGRALHIGRQIASALSRAHQLKIVHRDLKPENVMLVDRDGDPDFVKVLDFGIAKVQMGEFDVGQAGPGQPVLTQAGMVYGTPEYMAPEQALGQTVDARADLYALGCMLYEMLCGVRPFEADSKVALLGMQVTAPVPAMATKAPSANVPPEVEALVKHLLAKEASDRLGDAKVLADNISAIMGQLAANGLIQADFAPPQSRIGTGPGLGSSPDLAMPSAEASRRSLPESTTKLGLGGVFAKLEPLLAGKGWIVAAGGGLVGILVLVTAIALLKSNDTTTADADASVTKETPDATVETHEQETPLDQKIQEAISQIDRGNYASGIDELTHLGPEADGREDVHRALLKAYSQTNRTKDAIREAGLVVSVNPNPNLLDPSGIALRTFVRDTALLEGQPGADRSTVDEAYSLLAGRLGAVGFDDLYDIAYGKSGLAYPKAQQRAVRELNRADHSKMSPALGVTVDLLANQNNCSVLKTLLDRAASSGDERTLLVLRQLSAPHILGHWRKVDILGCIHEGSLAKATADLETKLKKR
jgi:serine/threonine-protein kinase